MRDEEGLVVLGYRRGVTRGTSACGHSHLITGHHVMPQSRVITRRVRGQYVGAEIDNQIRHYRPSYSSNLMLSKYRPRITQLYKVIKTTPLLRVGNNSRNK